MNGCYQLHQDVAISTNTGVVGESVEITYIFKYYANLLLTSRLVVKSNVFNEEIDKYFNF